MATNKNLKASKKGQVPTWIAVVLILIVVVVVYMLYTGKTASLSIDSGDSTDSTADTTLPPMYVSTLEAAGANSSVWTITSSPVPNQPYYNYVIEVDKDSLTANRFYNFTVGLTQIITTGYDSNYKFPQIFYTGLKKDFELQDTSNEGYVIWDASASLIDSSKEKKTFDFQGTTEISKTIQLKFNPNSGDLSTMTALNDIGDKATFNMYFGQLDAQTIQVVMKN